MYFSKNIMALRYPLNEDNTPNLDGLSLPHHCGMDNPRSEFGSTPNLAAISQNNSVGYPAQAQQPVSLNNLKEAMEDEKRKISSRRNTTKRRGQLLSDR